MEVSNYINNSTEFLDEWNQVWNYDQNGTQDDIIDNAVVQALFLIFYTAIFVLGIFGNALVCYVVFRNKAMQTVTNLFITNLALSDILLSVLAVPFTPLYTFMGKWIFGKIICHLVSYAQGASVYISTFTLTAIAIDRFFVIIHPFKPRMKSSTCIMIILCIWLFSILVTLPYGIYMKYKGSDSTTVHKYFCVEDWPTEGYRKLFGGLTVMIQFVIPFCIMAFCYVCVSLRLNDRDKNKPRIKTSKGKEARRRERNRRTNRMLIAMVVIFIISWLPLNVINFTNDFYPQTGNWQYYFVSFFMVHLMAMSSACYNPFLYAWLNENFCKEFKLVLPCFYGSSEKTSFRKIQQDSSLNSGIYRIASVKSQRSFSVHSTLKADTVAIENTLVPTSSCAAYESVAGSIRLNFINKEKVPSFEDQLAEEN